MKTHILMLSLLCIAAANYAADEAKAQAQEYLELIRIFDADTQPKKELREFLLERYENAQMCLTTDKYINAYQCETTYKNRYIFMDTSAFETDDANFTDRIVYFYEKIVNENLDRALQQKLNTCKTWRERDTLRFTAKRDFAQAVLDLLSQQADDSK